VGEGVRESTFKGEAVPARPSGRGIARRDWNVTPCSLVHVYRRFALMYYLHL
jgi:hypothetical protein